MASLSKSEADRAFRPFMNDIHDVLTRILCDGASTGDLRAFAEPRLAVNLAMSAMEVSAHAILDAPGSAKAIAEETSGFVRRALGDATA